MKLILTTHPCPPGTSIRTGAIYPTQAIKLTRLHIRDGGGLIVNCLRVGLVDYLQGEKAEKFLDGGKLEIPIVQPYTEIWLELTNPKGGTHRFPSPSLTGKQRREQ